MTQAEMAGAKVCPSRKFELLTQTTDSTSETENGFTMAKISTLTNISFQTESILEFQGVNTTIKIKKQN